MNVSRILLVSLGLLVGSAFAQTSEMTVHAPVPESKKEAAATPGGKTRVSVDCKSYIANPEIGSILWSLPKIYFAGKRGTKNPGNGNTILFRADLGTSKHRKIMAFKADRDVALVAHGNPRIDSISIVTFSESALPCREGQASALGVRWEGEQKTFPTYAGGNYKLILTDDGPELVDLDKNAMELLDALSLQKRKLVSFEADQIPLFTQKAPVMLVTYNSQKRELAKFEFLKKEPTAVVRLKAEMRLLQQGEKFGMVSPKAEGRTLQVAQVKGWSGAETRIFELNLPSGWDEKRSEVLVDFESGASYVMPIPSLRKENRSILLFDGPGKKLLKSLQAPAGSFFQTASLAPDGKRLAVLVASLSDGGAQALWIEEKGTTKKLDLTKANEEPKEEKPVAVPAAVPAAKVANPATLPPAKPAAPAAAPATAPKK